MNYHKITKNDIANGEGVRVVLWVSGCSLHCPNCHNPETHDFNSGVPFTSDTMNELLEALDKPYISGLTLSGGHPLEPENVETIYDIMRTVKEKLPNKTIWLYTGFRWENIIKLNGKYDYILTDFLPLIDVIVDGRYIDRLRDITLPFRGSSNQRIIDVKETLKICDTVNPHNFIDWNDKIVLWEQT